MTAEQLQAHVDRFFYDRNRSQSETASDLRDLRDHIDILLDSLDTDEDE